MNEWEGLAGNDEAAPIRRMFHQIEEPMELHLSILDGIKVKYTVNYVPVTEPSQDNLVLDQDIEGTNVKPFQVALTVGRLDTTVTTPTTP